MSAEWQNADLVLVLGTSLSGLNADKTATMPAERTRGYGERTRSTDKNKNDPLN